MTLGRRIREHLIPWTQLPWPVEWNDHFRGQGPLRVELGFGDGEFLLAAAAADPGTRWVGIEISWISARRLLRRLEELGLENVRVVQGDAAFLLEHLFAADSLDALVINHADPWPKKRHHARRLIQDRFLAVAAGRLRPGGRITVATDHADYADWIDWTLSRASALRSIHPTSRVHEIPDRLPTRYEQKGREAGSCIHFFEWERSGAVTAHLPRCERIEPMPNVLLTGTPDFDGLLAGFAPCREESRRGDSRTQVQLLAAYLRDDRREWLVNARVDEDGFVQELAILVVRRDPGSLLIQPASLGFPRPTPGVKRAVHLLAEGILERHPGLRIASTTVGNLGS